jgi:hypothetical protein
MQSCNKVRVVSSPHYSIWGGWEGTFMYQHMGDVGKVQGFRCVKWRGKTAFLVC